MRCPSIKHRMIKTKEKFAMKKKTLQDLNEQFKNCPVQQNIYEFDGVKYKVISHFTGTKDLNKTIYRYAFNKAVAEFLNPVPQIAEI